MKVEFNTIFDIRSTNTVVSVEAQCISVARRHDAFYIQEFIYEMFLNSRVVAAIPSCISQIEPMAESEAFLLVCISGWQKSVRRRDWHKQ